MNLSHRNPIVSWAYKWEDRVPAYTSLCALFWRTVFLTPVKFLAIGGTIGMGLAAAIVYPIDAAIAVGGAGIIIGGAVLVGYLHDRRIRRKYAYDYQPSAVVETFLAVKHRVCPIIWLE